jgi:hypothetical protein
MAVNGKSNRRPQCAAKTKAGKPCKASARHDSGYCNAHSPKELQERSGFGGSQPGAGAPRKPKAIESLRQRIEADIDRWLQPLEDALTAQRAIVVGDGPEAHVEFVPDYGTRIKAVKEAFDRGFGKAAQALDVKHSAEESEIDREIRQLLLAVAANGNGARAHN